MQWLQDYIEVTARRQKEPIPGQNPVQHSNTGLNRGRWWRPVAMETRDLYSAYIRGQGPSQPVSGWASGQEEGTLPAWLAGQPGWSLTHSRITLLPVTPTA